ncbi:MAG: translational GTPase TypA [bacterium]|nr:translational GTPase TypA [bacterium]
MNDNIRNVVIIAHVDHGKTTLVDTLLRQSKTKLLKNTNETLIMDSNDLERERGITIFSKNASVYWRGVKINIIDTPGHADFGGEVERVLKMADGCLLLIDAKEGPMPQTRFVLKKALEMKLKIIVVVSKIDKKDARIHHVLGKTLDLFFELGADEEAADFPIVYASAKFNKAGLGEDLSKMQDVTPLFDTILKQIPPASGDPDKPLQISITTLTADSYKGRIAIGRIYNGTVRNGQEVSRIKRDGTINKCKITSLMTFEGLGKVEKPEVTAGDIVAIAGIPNPVIGETISEVENPIALPLIAIEEPTIKVTFMVNDSPAGGKEGKFKTSGQIRERLYKEIETDTALRVEDSGNNWTVSGRGELHLSILIERMRREGFEFQVAKPQVIDRIIDNQKLTPYERIFIEAPSDFSGIIMQKMGQRHGTLSDMRTENDIVYMEFLISTKSFLGYKSEFVTDTRGLGIINAVFEKYDKDNGYDQEKEHGSLVSFETGDTNFYGLSKTQDRGILFVGPAVPVYKGQVVGQNNRENDLLVNVCREKHLSNMRSKGDGVTEPLKTPRIMGLEESLEYIGNDEFVEVTPKSIRIRKAVLDKTLDRRKKSQGIA